MAGLEHHIIRLITEGTSGHDTLRPCGVCGRLVDWRTELHVNPDWLTDPAAPAVLCSECQPPHGDRSQ